MNVIQAMINIINCKVYDTGRHYHAKNRANNMGEALEHFIKDSFAGCYEANEEDSARAHSEVFSYLGNQNNPPDMILKDGDAIEVKKIENPGSALALNSSYPKAKLYRKDHMLNQACRNCDGGKWTEKALLYAVGVVDDTSIKQLCFCYGEDYAAEKDVYERIKRQIKSGVLEIPDIEFAENTKELGRVNRVDPLGITYLRIRGMWHIENPLRVFKNLYSFDREKDFHFLAIINSEKYNSFPYEERKILETTVGAKVENKSIRDPNNPAKQKAVKVILFEK